MLPSSSILSSASESIENDYFTNRESSADPLFTGGKVVNIGKSIDEKLRKGEKFFSLELNLSNKSSNELCERFISELSISAVPPLFYATTSHGKSQGDADSAHSSLEHLTIFPKNTLIHLAANNLKKSDVEKILDDALAQGKINIFALRGDNCTGSGDFLHAIHLVKYIRKKYGNKFSICVAGFPQMHPESKSREMDIKHLKEKVDAGADFIITQIFFESKSFVDFVKDCRKSGIAVPIIPGIFPISNFKTLTKMSRLCSFEIPGEISKDLESIKENDAEVYSYGIEIAGKLIMEIFESQTASGFHLFSLNRISVALDVCEKIFH